MKYSVILAAQRATRIYDAQVKPFDLGVKHVLTLELLFTWDPLISFCISFPLHLGQTTGWLFLRISFSKE